MTGRGRDLYTAGGRVGTCRLQGLLPGGRQAVLGDLGQDPATIAQQQHRLVAHAQPRQGREQFA